MIKVLCFFGGFLLTVGAVGGFENDALSFGGCILTALVGLGLMAILPIAERWLRK